MSVAPVRHQRRTVQTTGRGLIEITDELKDFVSKQQLNNGLCHVFIRHTSASLLITENADSTVLLDLETILARLAPDGDPEYRHNYEGDDDMAAHIRCALTQTTLTIPVIEGQLMLGTWQGVFLWEHRYRGHHREVVFSMQGS